MSPAPAVRRVYDTVVPQRLSVLVVLGGVLALLLAVPAAIRGAEDPFAALAVRRLTPPSPPREFTAAVPGGPGSPGGPGGKISLESYRGRIVFLNFWATWCVPCREEMPAMERLYRRYRDQGLVVLALSVDVHGEAAITPFVKELGLTFPVGLDPNMRIASLYGIRALPSTFLLDRQGRIVGSAIGPREWDSPPGLAVIERLLAER